MKKLPLERRLEYWKYQSAELTFDDAREVSVYLIEQPKFPLMYQLLTSLYVLYGRPFKQRKNVRISEELVPSRYAEEHKFLIGLRDKLFAHADTDGLADENIDCLTKILLRASGGGLVPAMAGHLPIGLRYQEIRDLCMLLAQACHEKAQEILIDAMDGRCPPANLTYEIDLRPGESYLIKQVEWTRGSKLWKIPGSEGLEW